MSVEQIVKAWKSPDFRSSLTEEEAATIPDNPAGAVAQELDETELALIAGGGGKYICGCGNICSITTECRCWSGITICKNNYRAHRCNK